MCGLELNEARSLAYDGKVDVLRWFTDFLKLEIEMILFGMGIDSMLFAYVFWHISYLFLVALKLASNFLT